MLASYAEDNLSFEVVLSEVGGWKSRCDEECLAGSDKDEVLQQKEIENSLSSDQSNANEDEVVMLPMMKPDINKDKEELTCIHSQEKMVGKTSRTVTMMKNQNYTLIEDEEDVSQRDWACDEEGDTSEDESETAMSQTKEGLVL